MSGTLLPVKRDDNSAHLTGLLQGRLNHPARSVCFNARRLLPLLQRHHYSTALDPARGRAQVPAQVPARGRGLTEVEREGAKSGVDRRQGLALVHGPGSLASTQQLPPWASPVDGDVPWGRAGAELTLGPAYPPRIKWDAGGGEVWVRGNAPDTRGPQQQ